MQEKLVSIGDDSWIEDDQGDRAYEVDGKALRRRDSCVLKDRDDNEVATIQEKKLRARDMMKVERDSRTRAKVHKALVGIRDRFDIDIERGETISAGAATSLTMTTRSSATATSSRPCRRAVLSVWTHRRKRRRD
jgi:uncharacterized protein YxjI